MISRSSRPKAASTLFFVATVLLLVFVMVNSGSPSVDRESRPVVREIDGGPAYYSRFAPSLPDDVNYFPIAVWMESVLGSHDLDQDLDVGLNTYIAPTEDANLAAINSAGMYYLTNWNAPGQAGTVLSDEVDMWGGPGDAPWSGNGAPEGNVCVPVESKCGFTIQKHFLAEAPPKSLKYANYGKGVTFWENDLEASRFVNDYQDVVSADNYWFTDPGICASSEGGVLVGGARDLSAAECRNAANYGWTVDKIRSLVEPRNSKPVWALVEVGHPSTDGQAPTITNGQIRAAVWSSIIHGARGIVYFNHSFAGACFSNHVLRDCGPDLRNGVREVNSQLKELAPVLNSPFLDGAASTKAAVDLAVKIHGRDIYVLAASTGGQDKEASIAIMCAPDGVAEVVGENRSVEVSGGSIQDKFANAEAVHIYKFTGNSCGY